MVQLNRAHNELFRRSPDERFASLQELSDFCHNEQRVSADCWQIPRAMKPRSSAGLVTVMADEQELQLNDWSFTQLCRLSGISKDTINRLSPDTASLAMQETLPSSDRPIQLLTTGQSVRSLHGVSYTRLWNSDLLDVVSEFASDFQPPQAGCNDATGLYAGEQDLFAFLIDPTGWTEIEDQAFAPGFFVWNSEVGRRSLGIQTFWFQAVCQNHIVWDAVEVVDFTRKHTANVHDGLNEIRRHIETLVQKRDERRDGFARVMSRAMQETLGSDGDSVIRELTKNGIPRGLAAKAMEIARQQGRFTIYSLVDAMTRLTQQVKYIGDRTESDHKVAALLSLVA
ncbi:MAG: DUF932 domain-containing protein [Planctomycetota bacterium]|nr:DUF932 domain-containing protein [Planctomycetota bacterium]MDA1166503.1 DUF932 domain-containing protein [Planctomycetota bacterium]